MKKRSDVIIVDYTPVRIKQEDYKRAHEDKEFMAALRATAMPITIPKPPPMDTWEVCDHKSAPHEAGVYAIFVYDERFGSKSLAYIGESICLANRLRYHQVIMGLLSKGYAPVVRVFLTEHHFHTEPRLIRKYQPVFNVMHK